VTRRRFDAALRLAGLVAPRLVTLSLLVTAALTGAALAQTPEQLAGKPISSIEFQGLRSLSEDTLRYYLALEVGQPFDPEALDRNVHALWERHLIDDISVEASAEGSGVHLLLRVSERPVLRSITYDGLKKLGATEIKDRIDKEQIRVREGSPVDLGELERLKHVLMEMYSEKGYRFAQVDYTLEEVSAGERKARFTVDEGDKVKIGKINFVGNKVFSGTRLRFTMRKTQETGFISRLLKHDIYNPATLQEDLGKVRDLYRQHGYKNVDVEEPKIEVKATHPDAPPKEQKRRLLISIPIVEGDRWKFGVITVEGNKVYTEQQLLRAFSKPHSQWLSASAIDKGVEQITDFYRNTGYLYSSVDVELVERPNNVADVHIKVFEGEQYHVGRLEFQGNDRTRDKVLRREFRVQEGTVLNMGAVKNSLFKLNQLGYFKLDEENPIEFENIDRETHHVDLQVKGQEADRTELLFGGGWSELDGFFGQFSLQTSNFLGRGETVGVSIQTGSVRDIYEVSYFVPWLLDRPQSAGVQLFKRDLDYNVLGTQRQVQNQTGGAITYGLNLGLFQSLSLQYGYARYEDRLENIDASTGVPVTVATVSSYNKGNIRPTWRYDSIDNHYEPTVGMKASLGFEYAGGPFGGTIDLYRPEAAFSLYKPVFARPVRQIFAINGEVGLVQPYGGSELPVLERYYIGGSRSLRGHASRSITLRDSHNDPVFDQFGNALGGTSYVQVSAEYHVLLGGPFRLVFYTDGGNVFGKEGAQFNLNNLRWTAGAELRLFVPVFQVPLRFIYAKNLDPLPGDRFESFQFDIGTTF
jgi:outer membrane protein insertion porin family